MITQDPPKNGGKLGLRSKRGYVYVNLPPKAGIVLKLTAEWFEDYNVNHPHSGLKMRSPREFRSAQTTTA